MKHSKIYLRVISLCLVASDCRHGALAQRLRKRLSSQNEETILSDAQQEETIPVSTIGSSPRIVGGEAVGSSSKYPFMTHIYRERSDGTRKHHCGGSLIRNNLILTAAHCAEDASGVMIGRYDLSSSTSEKVFETFDISQKITHPLFDDASMDYDFAVLVIDGLSQYVSFSRLHLSVPNCLCLHVYIYSPTELLELISKSPIELDNASFNLNGTSVANLTVMGWGTTSFQGSLSGELLEAPVDFVNNTDCQYMYRNWAAGEITENMLCASRKNKDACQGDSGGPLIIQTPVSSTEYNYIQVGIVSFGHGCALDEYPGVYARVSAQYQWIRDIIWEYGSSEEPSISPSTSSMPTTSNYQEFQLPNKGDLIYYGNMFDVVTPLDKLITIRGMALHVFGTEEEVVEVYTKQGSHQGYEQTRHAWSESIQANIVGKGTGNLTWIPPNFASIDIAANKTHAFYVTLRSTHLIYGSSSGSIGSVYAYDESIQVMEGVAVTYAFGEILGPRLFNGVLRYTHSGLLPSPSPPLRETSSNPTIAPTLIPTSIRTDTSIHIPTSPLVSASAADSTLNPTQAPKFKKRAKKRKKKAGKKEMRKNDSPAS